MKNGIDVTATEGMRDPYPVPMRLTVHHPKVNVPVLWWRSVGSTHTAYVMETLLDDIARATKQDPVAYRLRLFGDKHPRHRAALQLAVDKSGYGKKQLPAGRAWGVVGQSTGRGNCVWSPKEGADANLNSSGVLRNSRQICWGLHELELDSHEPGDSRRPFAPAGVR